MRAKYFLILFCLIQTGFTSGQGQKEFTVNGKFPSAYYDGLTIYLSEIDYTDSNSMLKKDSTIVEGDKFTFSGTLEKAIAIRYLTLADNEEISALLVLESGTISLEMSDIPVMSGTVKNDELSDFTQKQLNRRQELEKILEKAQSLHQSGNLDDETSEKLEIAFESQKGLMQQDVFEFVGRNILNELGEFFFTIYAGNMKPNELERLYASSTPEFQQAFLVKSLMHQYVWSLGNLREGKKFKGIDMKSASGEIEDISFHFDKGNVVLIDFWASWCGPCIKSMPDMVSLYDKYKDKGFEIVGISLDENEGSWKAAIKRLGMGWPQYIDDLGGWRGTVAKEYSITSIPQTYLLNKKGEIAGHNLTGKKLTDKIEELLKEE